MSSTNMKRITTRPTSGRKPGLSPRQIHRRFPPLPCARNPPRASSKKKRPPRSDGTKSGAGAVIKLADNGNFPPARLQQVIDRAHADGNVPRRIIVPRNPRAAEVMFERWTDIVLETREVMAEEEYDAAYQKDAKAAAARQAAEAKDGVPKKGPFMWTDVGAEDSSPTWFFLRATTKPAGVKKLLRKMPARKPMVRGPEKNPAEVKRRSKMPLNKMRPSKKPAEEKLLKDPAGKKPVEKKHAQVPGTKTKNTLSKNPNDKLPIEKASTKAEDTSGGEPKEKPVKMVRFNLGPTPGSKPGNKPEGKDDAKSKAVAKIPILRTYRYACLHAQFKNCRCKTALHTPGICESCLGKATGTPCAAQQSLTSKFS
ncbi:hypothetical protein ACHAQH_009814 [Verticillium albo-atrum]